MCLYVHVCAQLTAFSCTHTLTESASEHAERHARECGVEVVLNKRVAHAQDACRVVSDDGAYVCIEACAACMCMGVSFLTDVLACMRICV